MIPVLLKTFCDAVTVGGAGLFTMLELPGCSFY
jgi:hypothetical protein